MYRLDFLYLINNNKSHTIPVHQWSLYLSRCAFTWLHSEPRLYWVLCNVVWKAATLLYAYITSIQFTLNTVIVDGDIELYAAFWELNGDNIVQSALYYWSARVWWKDGTADGCSVSSSSSSFSSITSFYDFRVQFCVSLTLFTYCFVEGAWVPIVVHLTINHLESCASVFAKGWGGWCCWPSLTSAFSVSRTFCPLMSLWMTLCWWRWARPCRA
jgi:hypothetical protein